MSTTTPQAQPQPRAERPSVTIPLRPQRRRRSGRGLIFVFLFILFIFVAPIVIGAIAIFNTVDSATEAVRGGIKDGLESVPATPATPAKPAVPPKGIAGRSLVRKANFAAALAKLRSSELRLTHLRLAPERIDVAAAHPRRPPAPRSRCSRAARSSSSAPTPGRASTRRARSRSRA